MIITKNEVLKLLEEEYFETEEQIQGGFTSEMIAVIEKEYGKTSIEDIFKIIKKLTKEKK